MVKKRKLNAGFTPTPISIGVSLQSKRGFTVIEMLIVLAIMTIITGVIFLDYGSTRGTLRLDSVMQEILLDIREAQVYGTAVVEAPSGSDPFNYAYGIHFTTNALGNDEYIKFIDINSDGEYDPIVELTKVVELSSNFKISNICSPAGSCSGVSASITFKRPNPDARIIVDSIDNHSIVVVKISDGSGALTKSIIVEKSGQMYIQ